MTRQPFIIGLKAGIGRSFAEAEVAVKLAKRLKDGIEETDSFSEAREKVLRSLQAGKHAIALYQGPTLAGADSLFENRDSLQEKVDNRIILLKEIGREYGEVSHAYQALREVTEEACLDETTGALTPFGYLFRERELQERRTSNLRDNESRYVVLMDGNDMHGWNTLATYAEVTTRLNAIGKALVAGTRHDKERSRTLDLVLAPGSVTRTHGSAGDEFVVDLYCPRDDVVKVVQRLFANAYKAQDALHAPEQRLL